MLERINDSGIGAQGLGGWVTVMAVHVERYPCHIASLPVAVNTECHAHRVKTVVLGNSWSSNRGASLKLGILILMSHS